MTAHELEVRHVRPGTARRAFERDRAGLAVGCREERALAGNRPLRLEGLRIGALAGRPEQRMFAEQIARARHQVASSAFVRSPCSVRAMAR